jgi:hypothetical protein
MKEKQEILSANPVAARNRFALLTAVNSRNIFTVIPYVDPFRFFSSSAALRPFCRMTFIVCLV